MTAHQATYPVRLMNWLLGVSASGFYAWLKRPPSERALQNIALTAKIHAIHRRSGGAYNAPSIHAELTDDLFGEVQQADLVSNDILCTMNREGHLSTGFDWRLGAYFITGNPRFYKPTSDQL